MATTTNTISGASRAAVATRLTKAACRTPLSTSQCISHTPTEAPITEGRLLPWPKTGKKKESALKITTALETLPSQALTQ